MTRTHLAWLGAPVLLALALVPSCSDEKPMPAADYVGRQSCVECHAQEHESWHGSHHDLAMQEATKDTVLGDFADATFDHFGTTTKFYKKGDTFMVRTDGADGALTDFEVKYVFGVYPLQQLLVPFPRGRLQALSICWDSRPKAEGGQRWFHLHDEKIDHKDVLHWSGRAQNWNYMCANCHSTNLQKNYDAKTDTFDTTWSEIDVSCESCHGPASNHLAWAKDQSLGYADKGFAGPIKNDAVWSFEAGKPTATRKGGANANLQTETCARCHSRRTTIQEGHSHGRLHDAERVSLLDPLLYHADGQIQDEVYVYGSFVQSKMYHEGVTCTDCHDPHTLKPRAPGNALCARCHLPNEFDTKQHHHHEPGTAGAQCVNCHMPTKHYMVVDPRLDHSIRIPRPDLTAQIGTPNACNGCHEDKKAKWAADAIQKWRPDYEPRPHFGSLLYEARSGRARDPILGARLAAMSTDPAVPAIARATGLMRLAPHLDRATLDTVQKGLADPDPLVRRGALEALDNAPPADRLKMVGPLLRDPVRSVRIAAARRLADLSVPDESRPSLPDDLREAFDAALAEYEAFQNVNADQPWAHTNLGIVRFQTGRLQQAEASYRHALKLDDRWVQAYINLADLYRDRKESTKCEDLLREGLNRVPDSADLNHAFGLALHRNGKTKDAIKALGHAANLRKDLVHYSYAYGVALHSAGRFRLAIDTLERTHKRFPTHFETLYALASYQAGARNLDAARQWAARLQQLDPDHPDVQALLRQLRMR